ncbi:hypothetical protein FOCC_FOCC011171 [Frankliniella occidentalis]|nr:hypothetical protein FOCC_FOCC011171 [Frankliniella occidentalis]
MARAARRSTPSAAPLARSLFLSRSSSAGGPLAAHHRRRASGSSAKAGRPASRRVVPIDRAAPRRVGAEQHKPGCGPHRPQSRRDRSA